MIRSRRDFLAWLAAAPIVAAVAPALAALPPLPTLVGEWGQVEGVRFIEYRGVRIEAVEFMTDVWGDVEGGDPLRPLPCVGWKFRLDGRKYGNYVMLNENPNHEMWRELAGMARADVDRLLDVMEPAA